MNLLVLRRYAGDLVKQQIILLYFNFKGKNNNNYSEKFHH